MLSITLPNTIEKELDAMSKSNHQSKSEIISLALKHYLMTINIENNQKTPYELGKDFFGKYGSGNQNYSQNYKRIIKEKINAKYNH